MKKIMILFICLLLCSCSLSKSVFKEVIVDDYVPKSTKLKLTMVGDALIHPSIYKDAYTNNSFNFYKMFDEFRSEIQNSDLLYYNQESILGGENLGFSGYPRFNTPEDFGDTMIGLGFNIVSRANNHTLDKGEAGIINSCNFWNQYESVLTHGSACTQTEKDNIRIMEMNGITYTMLSYTTSTNGLVSPNEYYVNVYNDEKVKKDIESIRDKVDILMVAMHWGDEYKSTPNDDQIRISEYLASLGVDIIIGSHPHVIEPIKWIDKTLVIYSLGNFISSQTNVNSYSRLIGLVANIDIVKTVYKDQTKIELNNLNTSLIYTYYKNNRDYKIIPFSKLNDSILRDYQNLKIKYDSIVKYYDNSFITQ